MSVLDEVKPITAEVVNMPAQAEAPRATEAWRFDPGWYRDAYPDLTTAGIDPIRHYLAHGVKDGRNPNRSFDTAFYLSSNPDVARAGIHPFLHYVLYGRHEGRAPNALAPKATRALRAAKAPGT